MWQVFYGDTLIGDPRLDLPIYDKDLEVELNTTGKFEFTLGDSHPMNGKLVKYQKRDEVKVFQDGDIVFCGRIVEAEQSFDRSTRYTCEGDRGYLNDAIVKPYKTGIENVPDTAHGYFTWLVAQYNDSMDPGTHFTIGINQGSQIYTKVERSQTADTKVWAEMKAVLVDDFGCYIRTRRVGSMRYIDLLVEGDKTAMQRIRFGENLMDFSHRTGGEEYYTRVFARGGNYGDAAADKSALEQLVAEAQQIPKGDKSDSAKDTLDGAILKARVVLYDTSATQSEADAELSQLQDAIRKFYSSTDKHDSPDTRIGDKTQLQATYNYVAGLDRTGLSERTKASLIAALTVAAEVLANQGATQSHVNAAQSALDSATNGIRAEGDDTVTLERMSDRGLLNGYALHGGWVVNEAAERELGVIEGTFTDETCTDDESLLASALRHLINVRIGDAIEMTAVDLHNVDPSVRPIRVGDYVRATSRPHGFDEYFICTSRKYDLDHPENDKFSLGSEYDTLTGAQSKKLIELNAGINTAVDQVDAATALAGSKAAIFSSQPSVYMKNDLWVQAPAGDDEHATFNIMVATSDSDGTFDASDWERASDYTNDQAVLHLGQVYAEYVEANDAKIENLETNSLTAESAVITNLQADTAKIHDLTADQLNATVGYIGDLKSENITTQKLKATSGYIDDLTTNNVTATKLTATNGYIENLTTNNVTAQDLTSAHAYIADLEADNITASDLSATHAYIEDLEAENITAQDLSATHAYIEDLEAENITAQDLSAAHAYIEDLEAENVTAQNISAATGYIADLEAENVTAQNLTAAHAYIADLEAENITTQDIVSTHGYIADLEAENVTAQDLTSAHGYIADLEAENITAQDIVSAHGYIADLEAENITTQDIVSAHGYIADLEAENITTQDIVSAHGYIADLEAGQTTTDDIIAASGYISALGALNISAQDISAAAGYIEDLDTENVTAQDLTSAHAYISALETENVSAQDLAAAHAYIADLETGNVTAQNIIADHAEVGSLDANYAQIDLANIANGTIKTAMIGDAQINSAKIANGSIENADIKNGTIENAKIKDGTIETAKIKDAAITTAKIGDAQITTAKIGNAAVGTANIKNAAITNALIANEAVSSSQILSVSANKLTAGTINAAEIDVTNLHASSLIVDKLNGQPVLGGYAYVNKNISGYSSKNPSQEGWYEMTANGFALSTDTSVDSTKAYYTQGNPTKLYDQDYIDGLEEGLNQRIDGAIETFTGDHVPTLNTYPAVDWTTDDAKSAHVGDIYFVTNAALDEDGYNYRFAYDNTTSSYMWVLIKDSDVTKALGDISDLQSFESTTTSWINATDQGLVTIRQNHTALSGVVDKTVKSSTQLWFTKANATAPSKPTSQVTSTSTAGNAWRVVVPAWNASYPNYYYCWQYLLVDGTYAWSDVVRDIAMGESQGTARSAKATADAALPSSTFTTFESTTFAELVDEVDEQSSTITQMTERVDTLYDSDNLIRGIYDPSANTGTNDTTWERGEWFVASGGNATLSFPELSDPPEPIYKRSMRLTGNTSGNRDVDQSPIRIAENNTYAVAFWVRAISETATIMFRMWSTATVSGTTGQKFLKTEEISASSGWLYKEYQFDGWAGSYTDTVQIKFGITGAGSIEYCPVFLRRGESTSAVSNTVNSVKQTADANTASITGLSTVVSNNGLTETTNITSRASKIEQTLDGFSSTVGAIVDESVVGTNILTGNALNPSKWTISAPTGASYTKTAYGTAGVKVQFSAISGWEWLYSPAITVVSGKKYTLSVEYTVGKDYTITSGKGGFGLSVYKTTPPHSNYDNANTNFVARAQFFETATRVAMKATVTFTASSNTVYLGLNGGQINDSQPGLEFTMDKLTLVENISSRMSSAETTISQTANNVLIKATESDTTAAQGGQHLIQSLINVAPSGVTISADKVNIEGAAIFTGSGRLSFTSLNNAYDSKGSAAAVQTNLDNLEIGGLNLALQTQGEFTKTKTADSAAGIATDSLSDYGKETCVTGSSVLLSFDAKVSSGSYPVRLYLRDASNAYAHASPSVCTVTTEWQRFTRNVTLTANATNWYVIGNNSTGSSGVTYYVRNVKVETGTKATDWTPAPENIVAKSQRIYYRTSSSTKPTAPSTWVTEADNKWAANNTTAANWTTKVTPISNGTGDSVTKYLYLWTCEQSVNGAGALTNSAVLLDDSTTVIDGGNIITGSVSANAVSATSGTFDTANIPNLNASKINAGDISADRIKANVVSAIQAKVTDLYALVAKIGGFTIDSSSIRTAAATSNADNSIALSTADFTRTINSTSRSGLRFAMGDKFGITGDGTLYANGANITSIDAGNISTGTLDAARIEAGSLSIGTLSDLDVGGTNLLWKTKSFVTADCALTRATVSSSGLLKLTPTTSAAYVKFKVDYLDYDDYGSGEFTVSVEAKASGETGTYSAAPNLIIYLGFSASGREANTFASANDRYRGITVANDVGNGWTKYSATYKVPSDLTTGAAAALASGSNLSVQFGESASKQPMFLRYPKLEKGTVATAYSPAPEDSAATATNYITADSSGIKIHDATNTTNYQHQTSSGTDIYVAGKKRTSVTSTGLEVFDSDGSTSLAKFGTSARLGTVGGVNLLLGGSDLKFQYGTLVPYAVNYTADSSQLVNKVDMRLEVAKGSGPTIKRSGIIMTRDAGTSIYDEQETKASLDLYNGQIIGYAGTTEILRFGGGSSKFASQLIVEKDLQVTTGITDNGYLTVKGAATIDGNAVLGGHIRIKKASPSVERNAIAFYAGNADGDSVVIGAGAQTIIGSGESAQNLYAALAAPTEEQMRIASDNGIYFHPNCNTIANRRTWELNAHLYRRHETLDYTSDTNGVSGDQNTYLALLDKNGKYVSWVTLTGTKSGSSNCSINARHNVNGSEVNNSLTIGVTKTGTRTVSVSDADVWRTALSAAAASHSHAAGDVTSGTFDAARIPSLAASKINSGTFDAARIPDLNTSKLTAGTLGVARGGTGADGSSVAINMVLASPESGSAGAVSYRALVAADIPNLAASKINSGTFGAARIPNLAASKINSGTFGVARGGTGASSFTAFSLLATSKSSTTGAFRAIEIDVGACYGSEDDEDVVFGTLPVSYGGTGKTSGICYMAKVIYAFNATGTDGTVTLTETAANFTFIDIFFKGNDGYYDFTRVYSPNGKVANLSTMESTASGNVNCKWKAVTISTTSITNKYYAEMDNGGTPASTNHIKICGVIGYK